MFVGHFGPANIAVAALPQIPPAVFYAGVSFPDLLWGALVIAGVERIVMPSRSPYQSDIVFTHFPYSHSLVLTNLIALLPAAAIAAGLHSPWAGLAFWLASLSHWPLDVVVHGRDLPVLGFGRDRLVGWGLWARPWLGFGVEWLTYALPTVLFLPGEVRWPALAVGTAYHLVNANSYFGLYGRHPVPWARAYAGVAIAAYVTLAWWLAALLG
ncbi:MAG TPA: hypothetical protein VFK80_04440 [Limnochordia bacterium]|nr:hypothetical protein [Limnochordia bacterium]